MITRKEFSIIDKDVKDSLIEAFEYIHNNCVDHDYILFLAEGEYKEQYLKSQLRLNPYVIDNQEDRYKDDSRQAFFIRFMQQFYTFPKGKPKIDDNEFRLTMELMVYTHIWEAKSFLKQLFRFACLAKGLSYQWEVEVPEMSKHKFILEETRDIFRESNLKIATIISNGFHTSLRNAFAHSEYQFDNYNKLIHLDTYKGQSWDIKNIPYNEWTKKFAYSALLCYYFFEIKHERRISLINDFGRDKFLIIHPINNRRFRARYIEYNLEHNRFNFQRT